jgi:two-component system, NtrC family, sensor kinase
MKLVVAISLILLHPFILYAQTNHADSLRRQIRVAPNDTMRMLTYIQLGNYYSQRQFDSAIYAFDHALPYAKQLRLKLWEAYIQRHKGEILKYKRDYPASWKSLSSGLKIAEDPDSEAHGWTQGAASEDANHSFRLDILTGIHIAFSTLYEVTGDTAKQKTELFKARKIAEETNNPLSLSQINLNLGRICLERNNLDSALWYIQRSIDIQEQNGTKFLFGYSLRIMGQIYSKKLDKATAKRYFRDAIRSSKELDNSASLIRAYNELAILLRDEGDIDSSLYYVTESQMIAERVGSSQLLLDVYSIISSIYKHLREPDSTLKYQELVMAKKDSLNETENLKRYLNISFEEQQQLQQLETDRINFRNRVRSYTMLAGITVLLILSIILYRNFRHKQRAEAKIEKAYKELIATQQQMIQQEKMASLGSLTAGIAHEIQNPLNFVNNFSEVNKELIADLREATSRNDQEQVSTILNSLLDNEDKVIHHGKRADAIVKSMLQHSRISSGQKKLTGINGLCDEYVRLAYHGFRARDKAFNVRIETNLDSTVPKLSIVPQDIGRVILNLITNAFQAVNEKTKSQSHGYEPLVTVSTRNLGDKVEISIRDNGNGIPDSIKDKIFQPFFTTKPTGQGTGLGLSLSYDIVKAHGGTIEVKSKPEEGTEFLVLLPIIV